MTRDLFGTDGIRGTANSEPMTAETALRVAMAAGRHFVYSNGAPKTGHRPLAVIGKDTRLSGYMLEPAMVAGFTSIGMDVVLEAMKLWRDRRRKKLDALLKYARMRHVERAMRPYLETMS